MALSMLFTLMRKKTRLKLAPEFLHGFLKKEDAEDISTFKMLFSNKTISGMKIINLHLELLIDLLLSN